MRPRLVVLLSLLAVALLSAWFLATHEKVTRTVHTGYRGEARVNQFLAAEMLLNELGIEADSISSITPSDWLPDSGATLVIPLSATFTVGNEQRAMLDWVGSGGHLVLLPPKQPDMTATANFLGLLGFSFYTPEAADEADQAESDGSETGDTDEYDYSLDLDRAVNRIEISDDEHAGATLSDDAGIVVARREFGDGFVTVMSSCCFFSNSVVGDHNHARLLLDVTSGFVDPGFVWFVYNESFASLWEHIWTAAPYAVISAVVAIATWLWAVIPQFGPTVHPDPLTRRAIGEHITASGNFVWRNAGSGPLHESVVAAILHDAESRHPGIGRLPRKTQAVRLAHIAGMPVEDVWAVFAGGGPVKHREFSHNMQVLQKIRKAL